MKIKSSLNNPNIGSEDNEYPLLPLRDSVVFPTLIKTFYVGREESIEAIHLSVNKYNKKIFIVFQKDSNIEDPKEEDLYEYGILSEIIDIKQGPEKKILKITIKGLSRGKLKSFFQKDSANHGEIETIPIKSLPDGLQSEALVDVLIKEFKKLCALARMGDGILESLTTIEEEEILLYSIIFHLKIQYDKQIAIFMEMDLEKQFLMVTEETITNQELLGLEIKINNDVKKKLDKNQKDFFLNERIKEIQKEIGNSDESEFTDKETFMKRFVELGIPSQVTIKAEKEQARLAKMPPLSPEANIIRTYLETVMELPWRDSTVDSKDLLYSKKILDEEHYSLHKVKERILEFLAVRQLNPDTKGPILCFVGPPGTGKTSLARSVAKAIGREFIRISLGGVRDEAEIRGHRRTYLGALPGKIIQSMKKARYINPVFLLDEIDKMSSDFRGDPASALLEVLDPEQNFQFVDHYLEVPYDLHSVMFITTANNISGIPYPLLDRMEIIEISSYTEIEKLNITRKFLIPRQKAENGISNVDIKISNRTILTIIRHYTMEAGVRNLQRQIASICRKIAKYIVMKNREITSIAVTTKNLKKFLGKQRFIKHEINKILDVGVSHGLAWTELGGVLMPIESVVYQGSGNIILTGKIGDVMKESAQAAFSYVKANAHLYDIKYKDFFKSYDIHIHFPEGAIPKDGPSAGTAIAVAIVSVITKTPMKSDIAMTGEITLTGKVLPIGGLKEKTFAAVQNGKKIVIVPKENEKDIDELPKITKKKLNIILVNRVEEVFDIVFDKSIYKR